MPTPPASLVDFDVPRRPTLRVIRGGKHGEPVQLTLDLEWEVAPGVPAVPFVPPHLAVLRDCGEHADLPDIRFWTARIARAIAEVSTGDRPIGQLSKWINRRELAKLARRNAAIARHPSVRARKAPLRPKEIRGVRVCPVAPGIVETSAVLVGAERAQAMAMRFEVVGGRWLATAVELG